MLVTHHALLLHFSAKRETNKHGNGTVLVARALTRTNAPACTVAFIIFILKHEINYEHSMS